MSETANIQENVTDCIKQMIARAQSWATHLKSPEFLERNHGRDVIQDIIVIGYCAVFMSHMSAIDLEEILENTLGYFKTGLYDTNKTTGTMADHTSSFNVRAWVYTPDTHNDAGHWVWINAFDNSEDAHKCITMLKEIEAELKRVD